MMIETATLTAEDSQNLENMSGMLTRVETTPAAGWMLYGQPVEYWARETVKLQEALEYLTRKIADHEGLEGRSPARVARLLELEEEAHEFVRAGRSA